MLSRIYITLLLLLIIIIVFDFFQLYDFKNKVGESLDLISSQIGDLDEDIHKLEDLINNDKD